MPYYHCECCNFTFKREGDVDCCPDCGKKEVREAKQWEIEEFKKDHQQEEQENSQ